MKALVKSKAERGLWLEDIAAPQVGPNDVLIEVVKTAICGSDLHIYEWDEWARRTIPVPMAVGHEFAGVIREVGSAVTQYRPGQRVSGEGHITCGHCRNCRAGRRHLCRNTMGVGINRPGAFAETLSIPASNVFVIPDDISDELASIFDPLGNATHSALSFDLVGEDVLITGAGPIGCMAAAICRKVGARQVVVTELNDYRLEMASRLGATRVVNPKREALPAVMRELGMTEGFDVGLEMSGNVTAFESMLESMNYGGRVAILGILNGVVGIDWTQVIFKGLTLKGIYGREMFETWYKMTTMVQGGLNVQPVITHRLPVDEFRTGFEILASGQACKVILEW